jgi:glycosyltransferase involved in cell wall biosynthesis
MARQKGKEERLSILILSNKSPFPPNDGSSVAIESMVQGFVAHGHQVHLLAMNTPKHPKSPADLPEELKEEVELTMVEVDNRPYMGKALYNLIFSTNSFAVSRFDDKGYREALCALLDEKRFDFVQFEGLSLAHYLVDVRRQHKGPVILRAHNVEFRIWERSAAHEKNALKRRYLRIQAERLKQFELEKTALFDALVPITEVDKKAFKDLGITVPSHTAFSGRGFSTSEEKSREGSARFFFVGAFDWLPNTQGMEWLLRDVWPLIRSEEPQAELHVLGRNCPDGFKKAKGVTIHPDRQDASGFFQEHQILLVPLRSGSGLRIKIVEGMSLGKAVVSTSIGAEGIPCVSGVNCLIADLAKEFAAHALQLFREAAFREEMGQEARKTAGNYFDRASIGRSLIEFYKKL